MEAPFSSGRSGETARTILADEAGVPPEAALMSGMKNGRPWNQLFSAIRASPSKGRRAWDRFPSVSSANLGLSFENQGVVRPGSWFDRKMKAAVRDAGDSTFVSN